MEILLLGGLLTLRGVQSVTGKYCSQYASTKSLDMLYYMSVRMALSGATALILLILGGLTIKTITDFPLLGWVIAICSGTMITVSTIFSMVVMHGASVALASLFSAAGLLVPTIAGIFLFDQPVALGQWLGILCLFVAAILLASSSSTTNGKLTWKTILLLFGCMLTNGGSMLMAALFTTHVPEGNVSLFSFLQFGLPAIVLFVVSLAWANREHTPLPGLGKKLMGHTVLNSAVTFGVSQLTTIATAFIPVAVLFPISDGGYTILSAIGAAIFFKEKLTVKSICGVLVGVTGLVMIKLLSEG